MPTVERMRQERRVWIRRRKKAHLVGDPNAFLVADSKVAELSFRIDSGTTSDNSMAFIQVADDTQ